MSKYKNLEDLEEEEYEKRMKKLGLDKMMACNHKYRYTTVIRSKGEFFAVKRTYVCVKCGARFTVRWCEHK